MIKKKVSAKKRYLWLTELDFVGLFWFLAESEEVVEKVNFFPQYFKGQFKGQLAVQGRLV